MKQLALLLFFFAVTGPNNSLALAQESQMIPKKIQEFVATPPPDILNETLRQANEQTPKDTVTSTPLNTRRNSKTASVIFQNPFIPQIPQEIKPMMPVNAQQQIPTSKVPGENLPPPPQFTVSGVVWNSKLPEAIINGQIVKIGDSVSNWAVSEITKEGIRVTFGEQNLWVKPVINPDAGPQSQPTNPYRRN